ncbi:sigma 54-interacting transcriptional regulator [Pectobacterium punjabense]|uniref:sigma 54-interacting transcriptional regulator n=1 Tax=Pectobacterium punjabense TaxID=2108399 RepID=UPI00196919A5|nr:sigma 54-interacting transcriptional regulator [Pectobacterium punjabense]MBN3134575.1 sigma 54-interacting transcriptional regulator [Pectobacterium punjabense]MCE5380975.1 sigma 54-interacting transcriptional regulator [Pectobacterium punjabense]
MKNNDIIIFSVSKTITQRILNVLVERNLDIPVYEFDYFEVVDKAFDFISKGTKVIISRGGTAALLRNSVNIPIIEIAHDFHGIYRTIKEAKNKTKKIAVVGFPQFCNVLRHYQNITGEEFKICQVYNHYDIESVVKNLADNDYQLVIGGLAVAEMAKKYNLNVVMGDTDNISIEQALNESLGLLKYIKKESFKLSMSFSALNQSREAIMCIDQVGEVISVNTKGVMLFKCNVGDKLLKKDDFKSIFGSIINEVSLKDHNVEIDGEVISLTVNHFSQKQDFFSVITGFKQDSLQLYNTGRNKKSRSGGFYTHYTFSDIIGDSDILVETVRKAKIYACNDLPINIFGETGTGKELFAQSIHHASSRTEEPFIAINCAAIPESILESELFGYAEGAFTDARKGGKPGIFEMAMNGTVFIDEVSEAPLSVQVKLLRVLQEKQFTRLGGDVLITAGFRLITASNKELAESVNAGTFRQDLYYRINILELKLPALRERSGDVMLIIHDLLTRHGKKLIFTNDSVDFLNSYAWPGNVRELQAIIHRLVVLLDIDVVDKNSLISIGKIDSAHTNNLVCSSEMKFEGDETDLLKKQERILIDSVMKNTNGDRAKASVILGISPTTLWRKIKELNIGS